MKRWILGSLIILLLAFVFRTGFIAYSMYALLGVLLVARLMTRTWLGGITHSRRCDKTRANCGDTLKVDLEVKNTKPWPVPWVLVEDSVPEILPTTGERAKVVMLLPGKTVKLRYEVQLAYRGYHQIGPLVLESGDVFGLHRKFKTGASTHYLLVFPKVALIEEYEIGSRRPVGEIRITHRTYEDPTRIVGVREYNPGDSPARIHWKATARTGLLQSKIYEPSTVIGATIVVDFHEGGYQDDDGERPTDSSIGFLRSELAVTTAASLAYYIYQAKQQVGLVSNGRDAADRIRSESERETEGETRTRKEARELASPLLKSHRLRPVEVMTKRSEDQALRILESLARLEFSDGLAIDDMLMAEYNRFPRDAALLVITPRVTHKLAVVLAQLKTSGFAVTAILILNDEQSAEAALEMLLSERIDMIHVRREEDLYELASIQC